MKQQICSLCKAEKADYYYRTGGKVMDLCCGGCRTKILDMGLDTKVFGKLDKVEFARILK